MNWLDAFLSAHPLLNAIFPTLVSAAIGWRLSRWSKTQDNQIGDLAYRAQKAFELEIRTAKLEERMHATKNDLVRLNDTIGRINADMARREDVSQIRDLLLHVLGRARIDRG